MILAVIETRCGISFANKDVYLNIAGGLKISEPGVDLAAAASLLSALSGHSAPQGAVFCGEIGLSGEIRPTQGLDVRLKEAAKLGFKTAYVPECSKQQLSLFPSQLKVYDRKHVRELLDLFVQGPTRERDPLSS
jgi:DNA repair protein RadA/Sms